MEANGLKLHKIKSSTKDNISNIDDIKIHIKTDSLVVAYLDYKVLIGRYKNNTFKFYDTTFDITKNSQYVQKIRIFNKDEELLLWRSDGGFKGRYRKDGDGDEIDVVDAAQVLFGTEAKDLQNGFTKITETRGTEIILHFPFKELDVKDKIEGKRVFIQTRNYVAYNEAFQATYGDCRFVGFYNNGKELA
jgi:CRISPR-associated protein (TIGR03984 family)